MILEDIIGGGSPLYSLDLSFPEEQYLSSDTFIADEGTYFVYLSGGGGGGAGSPNNGSASGGNSGDVIYGFVSLAQDENVIITIGAGGSGGASSNNGGAGNPSSFGSYLQTQSVNNGGVFELQGVWAVNERVGFQMAQWARGNSGANPSYSTQPFYGSYLPINGEYPSRPVTDFSNGGGITNSLNSSGGGGAASLLANGGGHNVAGTKGSGGGAYYWGTGKAGGAGFCIVVKVKEVLV